MTALAKPNDVSPSQVKQCCTALYESEAVKFLVGNSFHPGGVRLTKRLGEMLDLSRSSRVLDVAAGKGTSAIFIAERFGCEVVGIDLSQTNVDEAAKQTADLRLNDLVSFQQGDAELLPFAAASFDAVICECAFCTFPNKQAAADEFARVLRPEGQLGLSDLTRNGALPSELDSLLSWIACIADARPIETYIAYLAAAGLTPREMESHDEALLELAERMHTRLLAAEVMVGLSKLKLPGVDFEATKGIARHALSAILEGKLGYAILTAAKGPC